MAVAKGLGCSAARELPGLADMSPAWQADFHPGPLWEVLSPFLLGKSFVLVLYGRAQIHLSLLRQEVGYRASA